MRRGVRVRISLPKRRPLRVAALAGVVIAFVLVTTGLLAALFPARASASTSSLEVLDGIVALSHDGSTFTEGRDGDFVQQGDVVRTGSDSHAVLTFFDGSTIEVEPDSELIVHTLQATGGGDILMTRRQNVGRSWHVVSRALTPNSKYEVRTPTATATVRGTAFLVSVEPTGRTNVQTTEGVVHAIAGGEEVQVPPGYETNIDVGGTPPDPATPAPPPPSLLRIVIDATPNAAVTDANKRTVGVLNGLPVRYIPGSTVQIVDGKLVITIPNPTLGRLDTHVQPGDPSKTDVDVNVQVQVGGTVVGNVVEHRNIDANGIAKGGVLITTSGTFVLPDSEVKKSEDPRIGRVPPPPSGGLTLPFADTRTPAPTAIVTPAPSFVPRFNFDPRLVAAATATPAPPTPTPAPTFNGAFQPYLPPRTVESSATPPPKSRLPALPPTPPEPIRLPAAPPPPPPKPEPTPAPTIILRTIVPIFTPPLAAATPGFVPTFEIVLPTATPAPTPLPSLIIRTLPPIETTPVPTIILRTLAPLPTPVPTPVPTIILRTLAPPPTPVPTPAPTRFIRCVPGVTC